MKECEFRIFTGNSNRVLAQGICDYLGVELGAAKVGQFKDGEIFVHVQENIRGRDIYVVQSTCPPVNQNLMELLIIIDALRRASADSITAVLPYFGYARQDRKVEPRVPITAKLVSNLITAAGATRVLTVDLHAGQIQGFFDIPVDNLSTLPVMVDYFRKKNLKDLVVVAPDAGGVERARTFAEKLGSDIAVIYKRRVAHNTTRIMHIIGDVAGKNAIIIDDMIDTGGTIQQAAKAIMEQGAVSVRACTSHPVFSGPAPERMKDPVFQEVIVTDTIPLSAEMAAHDRIVTLSLAPMLGEAIRRIHEDESVTDLFRC
jgi:ribose-phosphate pyrophosphokinase